MSDLGGVNVKDGWKSMYERVWDEADYVVPPAENGAFFVTTNVVITPNQTWGTCPEVTYFRHNVRDSVIARRNNIAMVVMLRVMIVVTLTKVHVSTCHLANSGSDK